MRKAALLVVCCLALAACLAVILSDRQRHKRKEQRRAETLRAIKEAQQRTDASEYSAGAFVDGDTIAFWVPPIEYIPVYVMDSPIRKCVIGPHVFACEIPAGAKCMSGETLQCWTEEP